MYFIIKKRSFYNFTHYLTIYVRNNIVIIKITFNIHKKMKNKKTVK